MLDFFVAFSGRKDVERELRKQAIEMGFAIPLVDQAMHDTDHFGMPKVFCDFDSLLVALLEIQDAEEAQKM